MNGAKPEDFKDQIQSELYGLRIEKTKKFIDLVVLSAVVL